MIPHRSPTVDPTKILTRQELRLVLADLKRQAQRSKQISRLFRRYRRSAVEVALHRWVVFRLGG